MREGSLEAPTRHPIPWEDQDFYDPEKLDAEMRRVLDICHGCRRCFNLCDSFPRLFDLVDKSPTGELDSVKSEDFKPVVDACTLCDMCYMTKCPYVPPHEFNLDFPHLMLRYRAAELARGDGPGFIDRQLSETDRNGKFGCGLPTVMNWAAAKENEFTRGVLEKVAKVDKRADLPPYAEKTFTAAAKAEGSNVNIAAPGYGRKAVLYATCFAQYNEPDIGMAAKHVLERNGVEVAVVYPECCGMPQLEQGDIPRVAKKAMNVAAHLKPWIDKGYEIVALVPSCALMLKSEWPLIVPGAPLVRKLADATSDITEYVAQLAKEKGLVPPEKGMTDITLHIACHARAQNIGRKAEEMLKLIPDAQVKVIERCSGHGGSWGVKCGNYDVALKVGRPVAREAAQTPAGGAVVSECPLARAHILQGMEAQGADVSTLTADIHPIQLLARAYGYEGE